MWSRKMSGAGSPAAPVEDDVVDAHLQSELDIVLDMIGGQFHADGNPAGDLADPIGESGKIFNRGQV